MQALRISPATQTPSFKEISASTKTEILVKSKQNTI